MCYRFFCGFVVLSIFLFTGCAGKVSSVSERAFSKTFEGYDYCEVEAVFQRESNSCGTACLTSVLRYWGVDVDEAELLEDNLKSGGAGYTLTELKKMALGFDLDAFTFSMRKGGLMRIEEEVGKGRPVICAMHLPSLYYLADGILVYEDVYRKLSLNFAPGKDHYVVVLGFDEDNFLIMDPVVGFVRIDKGDFKVSWGKNDYAVLLCVRGEEVVLEEYQE